ncbi:MAG: hypothetical protein C0596_03770 [Marinilabiliales bacterium]|nr:MAG: hypothetical protein C0596_03770 [Marinilabiliales bacterium]
MSKARTLNEVIQLSIKQINAYFDVKPLFVLQDGNNNLSESCRIQKMIKLSKEDYEIANWVFTNNKEAGAFTENFNKVENTFYPLKTNIVSPGVLIIKHNKKLSCSKKDFWNTFTTLISNALEREFLREIAEKARFLDESDRLYKTLFNSLSHEFRIPVATIMGARESICSSTNTSGIQKSLMDEILTASLRLNRLVENLLNISRLENDRISPRLDWYDLNDIINEVLDALENELKEYELIVDINENMPLIKVDFGLLEQVIYNVILNSIQHSSTNTKINLSATHNNETLYLTISDQCKGFNTENTLNVFNKFFRDSGNVSGGLGLGLSIVKGFIEAHKGKVNAKNGESGGAIIEISIPSKIPIFNDKYDLSNE